MYGASGLSCFCSHQTFPNPKSDFSRFANKSLFNGFSSYNFRYRRWPTNQPGPPFPPWISTTLNTLRVRNFLINIQFPTSFILNRIDCLHSKLANNFVSDDMMSFLCAFLISSRIPVRMLPKKHVEGDSCDFFGSRRVASPSQPWQA